MRKVVWSECAKGDLQCIFAFIARDSRTYAQRTIERIKHSVERLRSAPESGAKVPEWDQSEFREVLCGNYRIVYRIRSHAIQIVTVIHAARAFPASPPD
jgi:addiction module RelE/StbE family toxin